MTAKSIIEITPGRAYGTRLGHKVKVVRLSEGSDYPVRGVFIDPLGKTSPELAWTRDGYFHNSINPMGADLVKEWSVTP